MFENDEQFTANQILTLHILKCIDMPVSDSALTEVILGPGKVSYFSFQQCLSEMISFGCISRVLDSMGIPMYTLSDKGREILDSMKYMISGGLGYCYEKYISAHREEIENNLKVNCTILQDLKGNVFIHCYVRDNLSCVVDVTLPVASKRDAEAICDSWRKDPSGMYVSILKSVYGQAGLS